MAHNAPGKHYRKGLSLVELTRKFPDNETAERWFVETRWPNGVYCPKCGSGNIQERKTRKPQPYRCRDCRKDFSAKTGTLMQASNLGYQVWAIAIYLFTTGLKGTSSLKLHRDLDITQKSAWHLAHRIRETMEDRAPEMLFGGPVEADESYFGGLEKNRHANQKKRLGRGTAGKAAVAGIKDRATNQIAAQVVPSVDAATLQGFVRENTKAGARVYSDENLAYRGLPNHQTVKHSVSEYVRDQAHTKRLGVLLVASQAWLPRYLPPHEREALGALCE